MKKELLAAFLILIAIILVSEGHALNEFQTPFESIENKSHVDDHSRNPIGVQAVSVNLTDDDAVMGNPNAPVTMVEFGGFEETFSRRFWSDTFPTIKSQYIDTGKVKFIFRDFPLVELFPFDGYAALAAECVHLQGGNNAYFQMWNALYATNQVFDEEVINQLAFGVGYNITNCIESELTLDEVVLDFIDGQQLDLDGSPSFFVNGELIEGAQPTVNFQEAIETALNASVACFTNSQCNDANPYTFDTCVNQGQLNAACTHQVIQCLQDSDCGNETEIKYCNGQGDSCTTNINYGCNNQGSPQASCSSSSDEICDPCPFGCFTEAALCKRPIFTIVSPTDNHLYNTTSLQFNITMGSDFFNELSYKDWTKNQPIWSVLCKNCNGYGLKKKAMKTFNEGAHNLTFRAMKGAATLLQNVSFFIDSKDPRISSILPKNKAFTNGSNFYIKYTEDNCKSLALMIYSANSVSAGGSPCLSGDNVEKYIAANINSHNNQEIEYQFTITDSANNVAESRRTRVKVDTTKPIINSFVNTTNGRKVTFYLFKSCPVNFIK